MDSIFILFAIWQKVNWYKKSSGKEPGMEGRFRITGLENFAYLSI
jgi:hypothetical protein